MCKKLLVFVLMFGLVSTAIGQVAGVDDPSDMADSSGDIKRIEASVDEGNLNLTMTVYGVFAPSVADTPEGMSNRYYYHWLLDTDNNPDTGMNNSVYEDNPTNLETPIGADVVVMLGWRDGNPNGVEVYDALTEEILLEDYEYTIDGDTIHAVIPLEVLGLEPGQTIAVSAFQEGASNDWQCDWIESVELTLTAFRDPATGPLRLDVGNSSDPEQLEEGFVPFTIADSGSVVDGITVELGGTLDSRLRGAPTGIPYEQIYRDFVFARPGGMTVKLSGLVPDTAFMVTIYSWDTSSVETRIADWTANGEFLCQTVFDGAQNPPVAEDDYAFSGIAVSDSTGTILLESAAGEGTRELSGANHPFAFLNALEVELDRTVVLFAEDFEGLALGPNVDEELAGDAVWTDTPPEGWTVDESGIPGIGADATDGITEWAGWAFTDKEWWIQAAEDQDRSLFTLGSGTVAVADPDEWDDGERLPIPIDADPYDTWLTTPAIDVSGLEAGTLKLVFDSSWRPEFDDNYHQAASITASFDGGEPAQVLLWESDEASENYKPYATNETVVIDLDVPLGASSLVLEFGLFDAGNDWWWAIDNVEVTGIPRERTVVLSEDFEGLPLGPNVDEALAGDAVWTDTPPEGWVVDESGVPGIGDPATDGVTEWAGWAFADKAWWTQAAEDQNRSQFVLASGTVAVADPDEWDDAAHTDSAEAGWYKTFLATPELDISALEAGSLKLTFDSSWRPEFDSNYHQTANITASFDGGEPVEVLLWESDSASPNFKPDSTNETVAVRLSNPPGAKSLVLTFGLFDAGNDWWWAIDNVEVSGIALPEPVDPGIDGLIAFYALAGDVNDSSGNGINGSVYNAETGGLGDGGSVWVDDPDRGTVISFNGTAAGAYVRAGEIPQMTLDNDFTWAFWAKQKAENTVDNDIIFGNRMDENAVDFVPRQFIKFTPTKFEWHMNGNGNDNMEYDDIPADIWIHHAVVKTGDQLLYYRNGNAVSSGTITQPLDFPQPLYFGGDNEGSSGENWNGLMSNACIYDRALSAAEVLYLAGN